MNARPTNRDEAVRAGFTVDTHCYPWLAYKGPRFQPTTFAPILTDREADLLEACKALIDHHECSAAYDQTCPCLVRARAAIAAAEGRA